MRQRVLLVLAAILAALSVVILPVFLGPLALLASGAAIVSGARRAGLALLVLSAAATALGMYLGCRVACA